jgi:hypothetical protein
MLYMLATRKPNTIAAYLKQKDPVQARQMSVIEEIQSMMAYCESQGRVIESRWSQSASECQRFGHPPRLNPPAVMTHADVVVKTEISLATAALVL